MKRSVICFSILAAFVVIGAVLELFYSNMLAKKIDQTLEACIDSDFETRVTMCQNLKQDFDKLEIFNEIFFSRALIEELNCDISDLIVYAQYKDSENFERSRLHLTICNQDIYNAGIF